MMRPVLFALFPLLLSLPAGRSEAQCPAIRAGTVQGTVTATVGGAPIGGATVTVGNRTATTDGTGFYSFPTLPPGTNSSVTAGAPGYNSSTVTNLVMSDGATETEDFSLSRAPTSGCPTDTTQA